MSAKVTLQFQPTGAIPGSGDPVQLVGPSLTIGRGNENDLVLPDPDRMLSKRHCAIEDHNGNIVVVDMSTNGTFLNYGKLPLGNSPTPLNDGDILSLGAYEIMVSIGVGASTADILAEPIADVPIAPGDASKGHAFDDLLDDAPTGGGGGGDFLDDLLGGTKPVGPRGVVRDDVGKDGLLPPLGDDDALLPPAADPHVGSGASTSAHNPSVQDQFTAPKASPASGAGAIPDDWDDAFLKPSTPPGAGATDPFAKPADSGLGGGAAFIPDDFGAPEQPAVTQDATRVPNPAPQPPAPAGAATTAQPDAAARAFLKSLGAQDVRIDDVDLTPTLSRMGHVMRVLIEGMREILMTRTSIKSEFRIEQTMIQSGGNNPLKFSISPDQAIEAIVKPSAKGYLDATAAAEQALQDIKAHEVAMVTGMEAALKGVLAKLDPAVLEGKIQTSGGLGSVLKSKKARYWEVYESMYADISDQAENDFHDLFAREFARAYQAQLDKLK